MKTKILIAASVAAALAMPFSAGAAGDKASSSSSAGADKTFQSLDKNKDGFLSKDELKGTSSDKQFSSLDKNNDGKLSQPEYAAAPGQGKSSATGGTSGGSMSSGTGGSGGSAAPRSSGSDSKSPKY